MSTSSMKSEYRQFTKILWEILEIHLEWHWRQEVSGLSFQDYMQGLKRDTQSPFGWWSQTENLIVIHVGDAYYRIYDNRLALYSIWENTKRRNLIKLVVKPFYEHR